MFRVFYASCEEEGRCLSPSESLTGLVDQLITPANSSHSNFQNVCGHQSWSATQRSLLKTIERRMELNWLVDCLQNLNPVRYSYTTTAYSFSAFPKGNIQSYIYITPAWMIQCLIEQILIFFFLLRKLDLADFFCRQGATSQNLWQKPTSFVWTVVGALWYCRARNRD